MAQLRLATVHYGDPFTMQDIEFGMIIDIDHLDFRAERFAQRTQGLKQIIAKVTPGAAVDRQPGGRPTCLRRP